MFQVVIMGMILECYSGQSNSFYSKVTSAATLETSGRYLDNEPLRRRELYGNAERGCDHNGVMV